MSFGERLKQLRKANDLTQQEFADRLCIQRGNIGKYEVGVSEPSDAVINLICREFRVSESWLRTGEGEMRVPMTREEELASWFGIILSDPAKSTQRRICSALARLRPEEWAVVDRILDTLAKENTGE